MTQNRTNMPFYNPTMWNWHDIYFKSVSYSRVVTRSQTAFNRIRINDEEIELFSDCERHEPPNLPHLMFTMKDGTYGAVPRTIITRSTSAKLGKSPVLSKTIEAYKTFYPMIQEGLVTHGHPYQKYKVGTKTEKMEMDEEGPGNDEYFRPQQMVFPPPVIERPMSPVVQRPMTPEVEKPMSREVQRPKSPERPMSPEVERPMSPVARTPSDESVSNPSEVSSPPESVIVTDEEFLGQEELTDALVRTPSEIARHKTPNDPLGFLHDLLDTMSERPTDDKEYQENTKGSEDRNEDDEEN